jgi:hypothetical protein
VTITPPSSEVTPQEVRPTSASQAAHRTDLTRLPPDKSSQNQTERHQFLSSVNDRPDDSNQTQNDGGQNESQISGLKGPMKDNMAVPVSQSRNLSISSHEQGHPSLENDQYVVMNGVDNNAVDPDDGDGNDMADHLPATDGMVEYSKSSPQGQDSDGFSYSLQFAMHVKASTMSSHMSLSRLIQPQSRDEVNHSLKSSVPLRSQSHPQSSNQAQEDEVELAALRSFLTSPSLVEFLPQRHIAKQLLERYFADVHPIWSFLIEDDTRTEFEKMYTFEIPVAPILTAKMNLIFSLGCQFSENLANSGDLGGGIYGAGKAFYQRARAFVVANAFNVCSIGMLQALLLMAQYQQGTMRGNQFLLTIGHATRIAQCLGLHLAAGGRSSAPLDRELGRRLWWACFSLDRYTAFLF